METTKTMEDVNKRNVKAKLLKQITRLRLLALLIILLLKSSVVSP